MTLNCKQRRYVVILSARKLPRLPYKEIPALSLRKVYPLNSWQTNNSHGRDLPTADPGLRCSVLWLLCYTGPLRAVGPYIHQVFAPFAHTKVFCPWREKFKFTSDLSTQNLPEFVAWKYRQAIKYFERKEANSLGKQSAVIVDPACTKFYIALPTNECTS